MNKLKQNLGSHPNDRTLKELRMKIDRTKIDVPMMSDQRMTSQWWGTKGTRTQIETRMLPQGLETRLASKRGEGKGT